ncbi:MAG: asparagine synthase (glutamine-hydrolyzing), partial [bacterium]
MCGFLTVSSRDLDINVFREALSLIEGRGPDTIAYDTYGETLFGFDRLAIMDPSTKGMQPFVYEDCVLVCNGEIYNYPALKKNLEAAYTCYSGSDCEVLLPLYKKYGIDVLCRFLDAEFAFVLYDQSAHTIMAARDPIGIRPMFYGYTKNDHAIAFASEAKALMPIADEIHPFPPGHYYDGENFICYHDASQVKQFVHDDLDEIGIQLKEKLIRSVEKRLQSDVPVGFLLSGGLDSSLVCAIAAKLVDEPIRTFAIGMDLDPIDLKYAREVAEYIGSDHTEVIMTKDDVLNALREVIYHLETWDITTIRASLGMYLL